METNTAKHAERELAILVKSQPDPNNRPIIEPFIPEILALCEKFGKSGQSGGSAPFTAQALSQAIKKLCLHKTICPLQGDDSEFSIVTDDIAQNNRLSSVFKNASGRCDYLDAIVWKNQKGITYSGYAFLADGTKVGSRQYIKSFPFEPKTFVIDVIEKEVAKDDWEFYVKDESQLIPVFEYYDKNSTL